MQEKLPQRQTPTYETPRQHRDTPPPEYEEHKLGSAQPSDDPLDAVAVAPAGRPVEFIATERIAADVIPAEGIPPETQAVDFMTADTRPRDLRPREVSQTLLR
jgi:hypothetical protein